MCYTEARMSKLLLKCFAVTKDTINFRDNYDSTEHEPEVLPAFKLSSQRCNGIAVGMAAVFHHITGGSHFFALHLLMKNPDVTTTELMEILPGPDFPAKIVLGKSGIRRAYEAGRGSITVRGRVQIEEVKKQEERIIITGTIYGK